MDALARCWSDHFRQAVEGRKAFRIKDMTLRRARGCRRDLVCAGVPFAALWHRIIGQWSRPRDPDATEPDADRNALFYVEEGFRQGKQVLSWDESIRGTRALADFEAILREDKGYRRPEQAHRLLVEGDPEDDGRPAEPRSRIAAERGYNIIVLGEASRKLVGLQERTRLVLKVDAVRRDLERAREAARSARRKARRLPTRGRKRFDPRLSNYNPLPGLGLSAREAALDQRVLKRYHDKARRLTAEWDRARGHIEALKRDEHRLAPGTSELIIKTKFTRAINRRWQPVNFWPLSVTAKRVVWEDQPESDDEQSLPVPPRADWFRFHAVASKGSDTSRSSELLSLDISSSQSAILAFFVGLDDLEARVCSTDPFFKDYLANKAQRTGAVEVTRLKGEGVGTLPDLCKELWMQVLYGSTISQIVARQTDEAWEYRWRPAVKRRRCRACLRTRRRRLCGWCLRGRKSGATEFLHAIPFYQDVRKFLDIVRHLADVARDRDRYEGVVFADPFDKARVRWNPIRRKMQTLKSSGQQLIVSLPVGRRAKQGPYKGDAPVNRAQLKRSTAPMLVHMLDAYFSALVLQRLDDIPAIGIHDAWVVPRGNLDDLKRAIDDAASEWFRGLGGIYDTLIEYLDTYDPAQKYAAWAHDIKSRWEKRRRSLVEQPIRFATKLWDPNSRG